MMRRWAAVAVALLFSAFVCVFFACGGAAFTAGSGVDGGNGLSTLDAGDASPGQGDAGDAGASPPSDAGSTGIVYVSSATGSDANRGLSPATPMKTLVAAIAVAVALDAGAEVHACAGTYLETSLVLGGAVSLRGAYDCTSWIRTATFGYPTFDHVNDTIVENANPASQSETLVVQGSVPATSLIDGLTIAGAATLDGTTTGVLVKASASPVVQDDVIVGGAGQVATGTGSIGLSVQNTAGPEVDHDGINGGTGTGDTASIGVVINSTGTFRVHDNLISGGLGTSTTAGIVIQSSTSTSSSLENNIVTACDPAGVAGDTVGILVTAADASVEIQGSQVVGCAGTGDGGSSVGIRVDSPGSSVTLDGDRVYGGSRLGAGGYVAGVQVSAASSITIRNSMLHAGEVTEASASANGLSILAASSAAIQDDTVYGGATSGTTVVLLAGASNVKITNVIVLGAGPAQTHPGIFVATCTGVLATLDHDLFANGGSSLYDCNPSDGGTAMSAATIADLSALLPTIASDDLVYAQQSVCDDDAGCVVSAVCPGTPTTCLGALFGSSWTSDDGITGLFQSATPDGGVVVGGWTLATGAPCAIAQGAIPVSGIPTDLYGNPRNAMTPTIGAAELTGSCTP